MFWRAIDKKHPLYTREIGKNYSDVIKKTPILKWTMSLENFSASLILKIRI